MVILNALKILSSETRNSITVMYRPKHSIQKSFILPPSISVNVEIFPISEIGVFAQAEPLNFIDGYMGCEFGRLRITPCTAEGFALPEWFDLVSSNVEIPLSKITACVEENVDLLVESAIRKSEKAKFKVNNPVSLNFVVFFVKINRLKDALRCIKENIPTSYSLSAILPYIIYEMLISVLLNREDPSVLGNIAYISTVLDKSMCSSDEDRVLNAILVGLQHSTARRTPSILNMYSRISIAPHKSATFYYLLSLYMGSGYTTKYTLIGLSMDSPQCHMCSSSRSASVNSTLQSIISLESDLVLERTPCDLVLDEYIHSKGSMPDPEIIIRPGIGEYLTQENQGIEMTETRDLYSASASVHKDAQESTCTVYTEGKITLQVASPGVEITGILLGRPLSDTVIVSSQPLCTAERGVQCIPPFFSQENKYSFFISTTSTLLEVYLKYKGRSYSKKVNISVEVLEVPLSKKIASHRLSIVPGVSCTESSEKQETEHYLQKFINSPFSIVSRNPLQVRVPFSYNGHMLYSEVAFDWDYMSIMRIKETEDSYEIHATCKDITVRYAKTSQSIDAKTSKIIPKQEKAEKTISWFFNDKSKSGKITL
ncbi:hypothetical protein NEMIN01_0156 [Nematocida minor]|uniref:uncharacterized protein n=1 Tax=Nematocida minor TaxID=1912983 RepID=UPI00221FA0DA|nr:uncharacterized protein NEMIN01_0052 [Nematocida minor]XP_051332058.1 uncharacterized protein NEMIN01_0156 [Nematocida minor]KAI5188788.1 hypothetical protein NEMIN01_0052 [Nematocida minor]KAI5188892.1 hypothetical protein NEMIN01_0156 [Nematocida minor]